MKQSIDIEYSNIDNSVNFIDKSPDIGFFESRYVRRGEEYFIVYLSIQSGCNLGCRMCHLTATKQTQFIENTINDLVEQAQSVFNHYSDLIKKGIEVPAQYMHFNFMARGEVFNSPLFQNKETADVLLSKLKLLANKYQLEPKFLLSTIIPNSFKIFEFNDIFTDIQPYIYYSLYSLNPQFRKKWLPQTENPKEALLKLKHWFDMSGGKAKIHYAFIKNENDDNQTIYDICNHLKSINFKPDFNIVRYNPFSERHGEESSEDRIHLIANIIRNELGVNVKIIPRVGGDVKASCGMFIKKD